MTGKLKIVISDLHIGAGDFAAPNPLDDFTPYHEFTRLLEEIKMEGKRDQKEVEFIINGDLFEFLQVPAAEVFDPHAEYPPAAYRDSSAEASVRRLNIIAERHAPIFAALSDFIHAEPPVRRLTIIKGNHDVNLYWPQVKIRLRELLGATGVRSSLLLFAEEFINREAMYIEHGHQRTEKINRFPNFRHPIDPDNPEQLYYPPGSQFILDYFNQAERQIWWIDNVKPITALIWYTLAWDFNLAMRLFLQFVRYVPGLLAGSLAASANDADADWLAQLQDESRRQEVARQYAADPAFRRQFHRRLAQVLRNAGLPDAPRPLSEPEDEDDPLAFARAEQEALQSVLRRDAAAIIAEGRAKVVLFAHTHRPAFEQLPDGGYYINTGTWLWEEDMSRASKEAWFDLFEHPEKYLHTQRLPYARIDYDAAGNPVPQLLDFSGRGFEWERSLSFWEKIMAWLYRLFGAEYR